MPASCSGTSTSGPGVATSRCSGGPPGGDGHRAMFSLGVDVLRVGDLDRLLTRDWFRRYVYADAELAIASDFGAGRAREFLAGRFAAKEAIAKALGTGW